MSDLTEYILKRLYCPTHGGWNVGETLPCGPVILAAPVNDYLCPKCGQPSQVRQQSKAWTAKKVPFVETNVPDFTKPNYMLNRAWKQGNGARKGRGRPVGTKKLPEYWGEKPQPVVVGNDGDDTPIQGERL